MKITTKTLYLTLFSMFIFLQTLVSSMFAISFGTHSMEIISRGSTVMIVALAFFNFISKKRTIGSYALAALSLVLSFFYRTNLNVLMIFIIVFFMIDLTLEEQFKSFLIGITTGFVFILAMSLIGGVSKFNLLGDTLAFGFKNQNTTGYLISFIVLALFTNLNVNILIRYILLIAALLTNIALFNDFTAAGMLVVGVLIFYVGPKLNKSMSYLISFLPIILGGFTFYVGWFYGQKNWIYALNEIVTSRPVIWHYYLTHYAFKPFGTQLELVTFGTDITVGGGAFDGGYINFPLANGYVIYAIVMVAFVVFNVYLFRHKKYSLFTIALASEFVGFSENLLFKFFQSPISYMAILVLITLFVRTASQSDEI